MSKPLSSIAIEVLRHRVVAERMVASAALFDPISYVPRAQAAGVLGRHFYDDAAYWLYATAVFSVERFYDRRQMLSLAAAALKANHEGRKVCRLAEFANRIDFHQPGFDTWCERMIELSERYTEAERRMKSAVDLLAGREPAMHHTGAA